MFDDPAPGDVPQSELPPVSLAARLGFGAEGPARPAGGATPHAGSDAGDAPPSVPADPFLPVPPSGWTDVLTGTDGPRLWDRVVASEQARIRRYHRPATVCLADIAGYDGYARRWGPDVGERLFVRIVRALAGEVRSSDHIARVGPTRVAILLTETDEIAAINFVERARAACEKHFGIDSDGLRVGMGWASPTGPGGLSEALQVATHRLDDDLARDD